MALVSIVVIVAQLAFLAVAYLVMNYWPLSWPTAPNPEYDPLVGNRALDPSTGKGH